MNTAKLKTFSKSFVKKWWASLLMLPFLLYSLHQIYRVLRFNIFFAVTYEYPSPLNLVHLMVDNFLLITHEAGHTFFGIFGISFITILGGSLFQILLPLLILAYFWFNRQRVGMQFSLVLLGYSWLDVASYAADGGARQLPLIGGLGKESHDWHNLLVQMNVLDQDFTFGLAFAAIGAVCYLLALLLPLIFKKYREVDLQLDMH